MSKKSERPAKKNSTTIAASIDAGPMSPTVVGVDEVVGVDDGRWRRAGADEDEGGGRAAAATFTEATDFRKSDAAREILREIKTVMELSKKMRLDLGVSSEPMKPSEKPLAGAVKDEPAEPIPSGERNQVPPTGQPAVPPNIANDGAPATQA
ncbi:hypothetical protein TRIUR3_33982 [Triticum urartu]|uniref:Uncharacterized protein n=1 Tax=Triticum urartu TaxID=4572 RepID=M7ZAV4_TRIUA|nr:hypothetical protein TRIUR3_33982 [Triticum urartu]